MARGGSLGALPHALATPDFGTAGLALLHMSAEQGSPSALPPQGSANPLEPACPPEARGYRVQRGLPSAAQLRVGGREASLHRLWGSVLWHVLLGPVEAARGTGAPVTPAATSSIRHHLSVFSWPCLAVPTLTWGSVSPGSVSEGTLRKGQGYEGNSCHFPKTTLQGALRTATSSNKFS